MNKINHCTLISTFICLFLTISFAITIGVLAWHVDHPPICTVAKMENRNCYENQGEIYMEQYVTIIGNNTAFIKCGKVIACDTSPCAKDVHIGGMYSCTIYRDNLYQLSSDYEFIYILIISFILVPGLLISLLSLIVLICNINIKFNKKLEITKSDGINEVTIEDDILTEVSLSEISI